LDNLERWAWFFAFLPRRGGIDAASKTNAAVPPSLRWKATK